MPWEAHITFPDRREVEELQEALEAGRAFLWDVLGLELKAGYHNRVEHGLNFLGCRIFPTHTILNRRSRVRFRQRLTHLEKALAQRRITQAELQVRALSLVAFTRMAGVSSWQFRRATLENMAVGGQEPRSASTVAATGTTRLRTTR